jgi:hypothetical protein
MNLVALVIQLIVFGRMDEIDLGRLGNWVTNYTKHIRFPAKDLSISRGSAILQTIGFLFLGLSSTLGCLVLSKFIFQQLKAAILTENVRPVYMRSRSSISDVHAKSLDNYDERTGSG